MTNEFGQVPAICREVGLSCKRCTEDSARSLAASCKGLRGKVITQLFHQIYPVAACSPMSAHFVRAYKAASAEAAEFREEPISIEPEIPSPAAPCFERREVSLFRRKTYAAAS